MSNEEYRPLARLIEQGLAEIKITVGGDEVVFNEEGNKSKNVQDAIEWVLTQLKEKGQ